MNGEGKSGVDMGAGGLSDRDARRMRRKQKRSDPLTRMVWGLALLAAGVIVWLDRLNRLDARDYLEWWPLILVAFALVSLVQRRWVAAGINAVVALVFLPSLPFLPHVNGWEILAFWPLLISAGGVTLMVQALRPKAKDAPNASAFRAFSMMGGSGRSVGSGAFVGGDVVTVMGGCDLNLTSAGIANEAVIDVLAFWGGIEIKVPRTWRVESNVAEILGAFVDRTTPPLNADAPCLIIRGSSIMSGIEVKNPKQEIA